MGVPLEYVENVEEVKSMSRAICTVCEQVLDPGDSLVTPCLHVFCTACIVPYVAHFRMCPADQLELDSVESLKPLKVHSPFVYRRIAAIRASCPHGVPIPSTPGAVNVTPSVRAGS